MEDRELYGYLLELKSPWTVKRVSLDIKKRRVDVWAEHPGGQSWPCPECSTGLAVYDHAEERSWRHLDSCQCQTYLHARIPRVECPKHGVRQVSVPWAEPKARFTVLFERLAIDVLRECGVSGGVRLLGISWDEGWRLMERAVARRLTFAELKRMGLKVGLAWAMKEMLRDLWSYVYPESAWKFWKRWYCWATHRCYPIFS